MNVAVFLNELGLGGTEKAACRWACGLTERGHNVVVLALTDGPRRLELERAHILCAVVASDKKSIADALKRAAPDVLHVHAPGHPHRGDVLGGALALGPKIPVVQTNIFGQLDNPSEERWIDFRLFVSWTSCVQAARRSSQRLDGDFFRRASVAVYPLDPDDGPGDEEIRAFRRSHGIGDDEILFGRISRPDPGKWTDLPLKAFQIAARKHRNIALLLREAPAEVAQEIRNSPDRERYHLLRATADPMELRLTTATLDAVLHTSVIGESFGYGIAEPMNYGKPVIANSTPWHDQAQIELVRPGEGGYIASTAPSIAKHIIELAGNPGKRSRLGQNAQQHIRKLADPVESLNRLEAALRVAVAGSVNPHAGEDLLRARSAADYMDRYQFGNTLGEQLFLRATYYRKRLGQLRKKTVTRLASTPAP